MTRRQLITLAPLAATPAATLAAALALTACGRVEPAPPAQPATPPPQQDDAPPGMVWVPPGTFTQGGVGPQARADELPQHQVTLPGYWIDATEVTNAQFARFIQDTGYVTTAERPARINNQTYPPGALVFTPPTEPVPLNDPAAWWTFVEGASWKHPEGPGSSIAQRMNHPVVQVSFEDAQAYAAWAGKRLPTEAEWERAARALKPPTQYIWGEELTPEDKHHANIWQGDFPHNHINEDGYLRTAPAASFPPNDLGIYDMAGNVWEWTLDQYAQNAYAVLAERARQANQPTTHAPQIMIDPAQPLPRTIRGGSFLCHPSYCASYRPSARMSTTPDTALAHLGFRCVKDAD